MKTTTAPRPVRDVDVPAGPAATARAGAGGTRTPRKILSRDTVLPVAASFSIVAAWEMLSRAGVISELVSSPVQIVVWLASQVGQPELWLAIGNTMQHALLGLLFGSLAGVILGLILGEVPIAQRLFQSSIEFLRPIPVVVYLPLLVLVFGATDQTAILLVAIGAIWPMLYQTIYGVRAVDNLLVDAGRVFGLTARQRLVTITLPSISPYLATGLRISLSISLVVAVAIELIAGVAGLGWSLTQYRTAGNIPAVYGIVVTTGLVSLVLNKVMLVVEKSTLHWHVSNRVVKG